MKRGTIKNFSLFMREFVENVGYDKGIRDSNKTVISRFQNLRMHFARNQISGSTVRQEVCFESNYFQLDVSLTWTFWAESCLMKILSTHILF